MLIEFRTGNFRSFDEPQTFSLVASSDPIHPDNCIPFGKLRLLKGAALFGANASGKSNLVRAIDFMRRFVLSSATTMNVGDPIPVVPFQLNPESRGKASLFEATFVVEGVRYQYGFTATSKRVEDEWLFAYPKGRAQRFLERRFDAATGQTKWTLRGVLQKEGTVLKGLTRDNGLLLSRGAELNVAPLTSVYLWFLRNSSVLELSTPPSDLIQQTAIRIKDDAIFRRRVLTLLRHADLGISDLEVSEDQVRFFSSGALNGGYFLSGQLVLPPTAIVSDPVSVSVPTIAGTYGPVSIPLTSGSFTNSLAPVYAIRSIHESATGDAVKFNFLEAESNGTQRFFALAGPWLDALDKGSLLVIDELDCSMHPNLTQKLIELFQAPEANANGAQLVFTTHDSTLMDRELFRRDQIWIAEKDRAGASRLMSLYDFDEKPRNNEALQRRYLGGRYGGVPVFGPTFEDLELK